MSGRYVYDSLVLAASVNHNADEVSVRRLLREKRGIRSAALVTWEDADAVLLALVESKNGERDSASGHDQLDEDPDITDGGFTG